MPEVRIIKSWNAQRDWARSGARVRVRYRNARVMLLILGSGTDRFTIALMPFSITPPFRKVSFLIKAIRPKDRMDGPSSSYHFLIISVQLNTRPMSSVFLSFLIF